MYPYNSDIRQWQTAIAFACEPGEGVGYGGRNHWNRRFSTARRFVRTWHNVNLDRDRSILNIRRRVAVPVALFHSTVLQRDGALGHHLRHAKSYASLHLALNAQWVHGKAGIDRDDHVMNPGPLVFNG